MGEALPIMDLRVYVITFCQWLITIWVESWMNVKFT